jgi:small subunit ribosomal protein S6
MAENTAPNGAAAEDAAFYELMYVVNTVISDEQVKDTVARVGEYIRESGGEIVEVDELGSQRLAYPIEKKRNGHYVVTYLRTTDMGLTTRLERVLQINDDIMRHMVLRYDAKMLRHYERERQRRQQEASASATESADA